MSFMTTIVPCPLQKKFGMHYKRISTTSKRPDPRNMQYVDIYGTKWLTIDMWRPNHTSCRKLLMKYLVKVCHLMSNFKLLLLLTNYLHCGRLLRILQGTRWRSSHWRVWSPDWGLRRSCYHDQKKEVNIVPRKKPSDILKPDLQLKGNKMKVQNRGSNNQKNSHKH